MNVSRSRYELAPPRLLRNAETSPLALGSPQAGQSFGRRALSVYFTCLLLVYYFGVLVPSVEGGENTFLRYALAGIYVIGAVVALFARRGLRQSVIVWLGVFMFCGLLNLAGTHEKLEAFGQWVLVLGQIFIYYRLATGLNIQEFKSLLRYLGVLCAGYVVFAVWLCRDEIGQNSYRWQTIAFYAGITLFLSFLHKVGPRIVLMAISIVALYFSAARGTVLAAGVASVAILFSRSYLKSSRWAIFAGILVVFATVLSGRLTGLIDQFASFKSANDLSIFESIKRTAEGRIILWQRAQDMVLENPLGLGLGQKYVLFNEGIYFTVHNGYIGTTLETGFAGLVVVLGLLGSFWRKLTALKAVDTKFAVLLRSITIFYLVRGFYENYLLFNFANLVTNIFWLIIIFVMFREIRQRRPA
ncbi:MAG: hypothetical protein C0518_00950 [Opitutus sp.]|nr:hypothetical protein [Opitutus sp.]